MQIYDCTKHAAMIVEVAKTLASFRLGLDCENPFTFNEEEMVKAGHIVGRLWAAGMIDFPHIGEVKTQEVLS